MTSLINLRKLSAIIVGGGAGIAGYYYGKMYESGTLVENSWTISDKPVNPCALWDPNWDCRDPKKLVKPIRNNSPQEENRYNNDLEKVQAKAERNIILVRHGEYQDIGSNDIMHKLTQRGRKQAQMTGERLHSLGIKWDKVITSTMTRAQETTQIILNEIDYDTNALKKCNFLCEGAPIPPQPPTGHWCPEKSQFFRDGARIECAFRRYFHRALPEEVHDTYTLIIGHANVIRYFVCRALQLPPEAWMRINLNHASITWLVIYPSGNVCIRYLGDTGFMPPQYLTNRCPRFVKTI